MPINHYFTIKVGCHNIPHRSPSGSRDITNRDPDPRCYNSRRFFDSPVRRRAALKKPTRSVA